MPMTQDSFNAEGTSSDVSGAGDTRSITTYVTNATSSTKQVQGFTARLRMLGAAILPGGWVNAIRATTEVISNAAIDKFMGITSYFSVVGGAQVSKALAFEGVCSGLDATSNISQWATFYSPNMSGLPNIDRIAVPYAFANDWAAASYKNVGRYLKATKTIDGSNLRELAPARHPGYVANRYYGPSNRNGALVTAAAAQGLLYTIGFYCTERTLWTKIGFRVMSAVAGGAYVGLYQTVSGLPTELIASSGLLSTAATGVQEATISATVEAGYYFLVLHVQNTVNVNWVPIGGTYDQMGTTSDNTNETMYFSSQAFGPLPPTFPAGTWADQSQAAPFVWLRK